MEVNDVLQQLGLIAYANIFKKNGITMELIKGLNEKLIAELIPEVGPRMIFISYWKTKFSEQESNTTLDTEMNNIENSQNVANVNNEKFQNTTQGTDENKSGKIYEQHACTSHELFAFETMPKIDDLLQQSKTGRIILSVSKSKELNATMRNKLCNIIITYMEDHNIVMTNEIAKTISKNIVKIFPSEAEGTYFIEARKKISTVQQKSIAAKGKLLSCWRNRKYTMRKLQTKLPQDDDTDDFSDNENNKSGNNEDVKKAVDWLQINQAPWEIVVEKWSLTSKYRLQEITKSPDKILSQIFETWPLLKHPYGYKLIKQDFDEMQLTNFCLTSEKWDEFFNIIKENMQFIPKNYDFTDLIEKLNLDISEDSKVAITIQLLSYMIPPRHNVKQKDTGKKKRHVKASISLSRGSMIRYAASSADITLIRQEAINKAKELQTSIQPYVIVVGSCENISHSYVMIDEVLYMTESTIEALDTCFKAFHVLKLNYPDASKHIWMLIQKGLFKFRTQWDESFSNTEYFMKKFNNLK